MLSSSNDHEPRGLHAIVDGEGADATVLNDEPTLKGALVSALRRIGATVLDVVTQRFDPQGCTVIAVLAESHASLHTYPEHGVYMLDVFTCGGLDADRAAQAVAVAIGGSYRSKLLQRGPEKRPGEAGRLTVIE